MPKVTDYINTPEKITEYKRLINAVKNSKTYQNEITNLNISDKDMDLYLSYWFYTNSKILNKYDSELVIKEDLNSKREASEKIMTKMVESLLAPSKLVKTFLDTHNRHFKNFNHPALGNKNPFLLEKDQVRDRFDISKNSEIEIYAQNIVWSSRIAKDIDMVKRNIIMKNIPKNTSNSDIIEFGKEFESVAAKMMVGSIKKQNKPIKDDFCEAFEKYIKKEISKEELENTESYKKVNELTQKRDIAKKYNLTPELIYQYLMCREACANLYSIKHHSVDATIKSYAEMKKQNRDTSKIKLYKSMDKAKAGKLHESRFIISIADYNTDFIVHEKPEAIKDAEAKYGVKIEKSLGRPPYNPTMVYKYTEEQKRLIEKLSRANLNRFDTRKQDIIDYEANRIYMEKLIDKNIKNKKKQSRRQEANER